MHRPWYSSERLSSVAFLFRILTRQTHIIPSHIAICLLIKQADAQWIHSNRMQPNIQTHLSAFSYEEYALTQFPQSLSFGYLLPSLNLIRFVKLSFTFTLNHRVMRVIMKVTVWVTVWLIMHCMCRNANSPCLTVSANLSVITDMNWMFAKRLLSGKSTLAK